MAPRLRSAISAGTCPARHTGCRGTSPEAARRRSSRQTSSATGAELPWPTTTDRGSLAAPAELVRSTPPFASALVARRWRGRPRGDRRRGHVVVGVGRRERRRPRQRRSDSSRRSRRTDGDLLRLGRTTRFECPSPRWRCGDRGGHRRCRQAQLAGSGARRRAPSCRAERGSTGRGHGELRLGLRGRRRLADRRRAPAARCRPRSTSRS